MSSFEHKALHLQKDKPFVYTAMSKHLFYNRMFVSKFVLEHGGVPLNPFMIFDYFLTDSVDRDLVREGNNNLVKRADEIWVFGTVSDGVFAEVKIAREAGKEVKFFKLEKPNNFIEIDAKKVEMEDEVRSYKDEL